MYKKFFSLHYDDELILGMLKGSRAGIFGSHFIGPLIVIYASYGYIPIQNQVFWFFMHILTYIIKLKLNNKLTLFIQTKDNRKTKYVYLYFLAMTVTALLYGAIGWGSLKYGVPDVNLFLIGTVIISIAASSIGSVGTVFPAFLIVMIFGVAPFILSLIYHGDTLFLVYAFLLTIFFIVNIIFGYRLYLTNKRSVELKKKYQTIYDQSSDGIILMKNTKMIECNEAILKMFGYKNDREGFFKAHIASFSPRTQPDGKNSMRKMLFMLKESKSELITFEWLHKKRDGEDFWAEITLRKIEVNQQEVVHGIWRDITARKKAEEKLELLTKSLEQRVKDEVEKNRAKDQLMLQQSRLAQMGEMINMIAHQWRQPLSAITMRTNNLLLELVISDKLNRETFEKDLNQINDYSQHLSQTIDDFRSFFKDKKEKEKSSLKEIVEGALNITQASLESKGIVIVTDLECIGEITTYPNEIKQVVLNIIKNSEDVLLEKSIENPTIYIKTMCNIGSNEKKLIIKDNGGGIPVDILDRIFDPYFSTKLEKEGTGIGLYMSKIIVEKHCGGRLEVSNDVDGAVFEIILN